MTLTKTCDTINCRWRSFSGARIQLKGGFIFTFYNSPFIRLWKFAELPQISTCKHPVCRGLWWLARACHRSGPASVFEYTFTCWRIFSLTHNPQKFVPIGCDLPCDIIIIFVASHCIPNTAKVGRGNLVLRYSLPQFGTHCVLSGGTQRYYLPRHQSE